jgi:hypothetical protein
VLTLDEVFDNLLLVQCIRVAEDMKRCRSPVESVDPEMFREPILEVVLFLQLQNLTRIRVNFIIGPEATRQEHYHTKLCELGMTYSVKGLNVLDMLVQEKFRSGCVDYGVFVFVVHDRHHLNVVCCQL